MCALSSGVLSHLSLLEVKARSRKTQLQQHSRVMELKAKVEALKTQREQLKAQIQTHQVWGLMMVEANLADKYLRKTHDKFIKL